MNHKITIKDIAELSGTSKTTVSFYLNGKLDKMSSETRDRIAKVIEETHFQPSLAARLLNTKSSRLIGVLVGDITNTFASQVVKGINIEADDNDYQIIMGNSNYDFAHEEAYIRRMLAMGVDGFIVQPTVEFKPLALKIQEANKPIVFIDSQLSDIKGMWVKTNNYEAVLEETENLLDQGYENFVIVTGDPSVLSVRKERYRGFHDILLQRGKKCEMIIVDDNTSDEEVSKKLEEAIDYTKPTVVFAANGWCLPKVYMALKKHSDLIPETIGVVGFDSQEWIDFASPTITTIVQPAYEEGLTACKILIDAIEGTKKEAPNQILRCVLKEGQSTRNTLKK